MRKVLGMAAAVAMSFAGTAMAGTVVVDIGGLASMDFQLDPSNDTVAVGGFAAGDVITSISYDVNFTPVEPSWQQETVYSLWDGSVGGPVVLDNSGGAFIYAGATDVSDPYAGSGNHDITDYVMTTDTLVVELHEWDFDDHVDAPDSIYGTGSMLTINFEPVPAPAALALLGVAGLATGHRRRCR